MTRQHKTINLDPEVTAHIREKKKECGFNFSDWVNLTYKDSFMSVQSKQQAISDLKSRLAKLEEEVKVAMEKDETYSDIISETEKRFMLQVPRLIQEGKEWGPLTTRFNSSFSRHFTVGQFMKVVGALDARRKKT